MKKLILALAATAMTAAPAFANNAATKLSVAPKAARASAKEGESKLGGSLLITALVAAAVIAGIIIIADDNNSKSS